MRRRRERGGRANENEVGEQEGRRTGGVRSEWDELRG